HHADLPAVAGDAAARDAPGVLAVDDHLAAGRPVDQGDQPEQGALAGARVAGHEHHFPPLDRQAQVAQRFLAAGKALGDVLDTDQSASSPSAVAGRSSASTYSSATNGCMSSSASPIPM